jgi:hypothetical protein
MSVQSYEPYRPLTIREKKRASRYLYKCEAKAAHFKHMKKQLLAHIESRKLEQPFTHTFLEYVMLEVAFHNAVRRNPPKSIGCRFADFKVLQRIRWECRSLWGACPKYYAMVYRNIINQALCEAGIPHAFDHYIFPESRR